MKKMAIFIILYLGTKFVFANNRYVIEYPCGLPNLTVLSRDEMGLAIIAGTGSTNTHCFVLNIKTKKLSLIDGTSGIMRLTLTWCNTVTGKLIGRVSKISLVGVLKAEKDPNSDLAGRLDFINSIYGHAEHVDNIFNSYFSFSPSGKYIAGTIVTNNIDSLFPFGCLAIIDASGKNLRVFHNIMGAATQMPVWMNENTLYLSEYPCANKIIKVKLSKKRDKAYIEKTINGRGFLLGAWQGKCAYSVYGIGDNSIFVDDDKQVHKIKVLTHKDYSEYFILRKGKLLGCIHIGSYTNMRILDINGTVLWKHKIKGKYSVYDYDATNGIIYLWQKDKPYYIYKMKTNNIPKIKKIFDVATVTPLLKVFE